MERKKKEEKARRKGIQVPRKRERKKRKKEKREKAKRKGIQVPRERERKRKEKKKRERRLGEREFRFSVKETCSRRKRDLL